jgi:GNAT superfamily N-acetyltransferase
VAEDSPLLVRPARPEEAAEISALALRSKAHWGYDAEFLAACREDLTIDPAWCDGVRLIVAESGDGDLLGYARVAGSAPVGELAGLFVDPPAIGRGVGGLLLRHAVAIAADLGFRTLEIDSDPYAEPFYRHAGAVRVGESVSTVDPTRRLPRLELAVPYPDS